MRIITKESSPGDHPTAAGGHDLEESWFHRHHILIAVLVFLAVLAALTHNLAGAEPRIVSLGQPAQELTMIVGANVEVHTTAALAADRAMGPICKSLADAFRDAVKDPETRDRLSRIVHDVTIEGWHAGNELHHVELKNEVLQVQTLTTVDAVDTLRPLITEVLKKVAHLDAHRGH